MCIGILRPKKVLLGALCGKPSFAIVLHRTFKGSPNWSQTGECLRLNRDLKESSGCTISLPVLVEQEAPANEQNTKFSNKLYNSITWKVFLQLLSKNIISNPRHVPVYRKHCEFALLTVKESARAHTNTQRVIAIKALKVMTALRTITGSPLT